MKAKESKELKLKSNVFANDTVVVKQNGVENSMQTSDYLLKDRTHFKGWFVSAQELSQKFPTCIPGDYAYVGALLHESTVYRCAREDIWENTNEIVSLPEIDLGPLTTRLSAVEESVGENAEKLNKLEDETKNTLDKRIGKVGRDNIFTTKKNIIPTMYPVRRYTSNNDYNEYDSGYSQELSEKYISVNIPQSGGATISHFIKTDIEIEYPYLINVSFCNAINKSYGQIGIGYIDNTGDYIGYVLSSNGVVRKVINKITYDLKATGYTFDKNSKVQFELYNDNLTISLDNMTILSIYVPNYNGNLTIVQTGFISFDYNIFISNTIIKDFISKNITMLDKVSPKCMFSFNLMKEIISIYVKIKDNIYVCFSVVHEVSSEINVDYWRIYDAELYEYNNMHMISLSKKALSVGESECVYLRSSDSEDYTGGYHGDEKYTDISFLVDGVAITLKENIPLTPCNEFSYIVHSEMYKTPESGFTDASIEAFHIKKTDFYNGGYKTFNRLIWNINNSIAIWYHGIACIAKDCAKYIATDYDYKYIEYTGSLPQVDRIGSKYMYAYNKENNLSAMVTSKLLKPSKDRECIMFIADRGDDSKYYRKLSGATVRIGDIWESQMMVSFASGLFS